MRIKYLGHACFLFSGKQKSILVDPFGNIGYSQEFCEADFCLCSHEHYDHCSLDFVKAKQVITDKNWHCFDFIDAVFCHHDNEGGVKRGKNCIFIIQLDGVRICHMGDIGESFNVDLVQKLGQVDILCVPVGGNYTIDFLEAEKYVRAIKPSIVLPMHYKTSRSDIDIAAKNDFINQFTDVVKRNRDFEITQNDFRSDKIIVYDINDDLF